MKVGIFGDVHINKNMRTLQYIWEKSVTESILEMYTEFDKLGVDFVVGVGDFFDKPTIEAKSLHLLLPILEVMNSRSYPTYLLLGNHEIDDDDHNILEYLSEYTNIKPVTDCDILRNEFTLIPYNVDPAELSPEYMKDRYVFTHHDIYGSELASGKSRAVFGLDPSIFEGAKMVFNGHVHLKSQPYKNIMNTGSLLVSQQGELKIGDYPEYYVLDSDSSNIYRIENRESMIYLAGTVDELMTLSEYEYKSDRLVLRVDYNGSIPEQTIDTVHTSYRKIISSIAGESNTPVIKSNTFDLKNYLVLHIKKDSKVPDDLKDKYIQIGLEELS